jgi:WD40 repeat protein
MYMYKFRQKLLASSKPPRGRDYTQETKDRKGHAGSVTTLAVSKSGNRLVTGSTDLTLKVWDVNTGRLDYTLRDHPVGSSYRYQCAIESVAFSSAGHFASAANTHRERNVLIWRDWNEPEEPEPSDISKDYSQWNKHTPIIQAVAFNPDGDMIAKGNDDGVIELWRSSASESKRAFWTETNRREVATLEQRFSDRNIKEVVKDAKTGNPTSVKASHSSDVTSLAFSAEGDKLASGSSDGTVKIWRVSNGVLLHVLKGEGGVKSVIFNRDGKQLISAVGNNVRNKDGTIGSVNCEVRIWDIEKEIVLHRLLGHTGIVSSVAYNNKNVKYPLVISGSWDGTVKIWNAETGKLYQTLDAKSAVYDIAYNQRNNTIFAGLQDGSIDIFERNNNNTGVYTALLSMKQIDNEINARDKLKKEKSIRKNLEKTARTARTTMRARSTERAKSSSTKNTRRARSASAKVRSTSVKSAKVGPEPTTKDPLQGKRLADAIASEDVRRLVLGYAVDNKDKKPPAKKEMTPESEFESESESDNESDNESDSDSD